MYRQGESPSSPPYIAERQESDSAGLAKVEDGGWEPWRVPVKLSCEVCRKAKVSRRLGDGRSVAEWW